MPDSQVSSLKGGECKYMLRNKIIKKPYIFGTLLLAIMLACIPPNLSAMPISSRLSSSEILTERENDIVEIAIELEKKIIKEKFNSLGMTPSQVMRKINSLSNEEIHQLASKVDDIKVAGDVGAVAAVLIVALLIILILELTGKRVISRK